MKVSVSKSKNQTIYYLSKSVWVDGKSTTKTIEKIGSEDELLKVCGDLTPLEWAKQYAAKRSAEEKASKKDIMLKYSSSTLIKKEACRSVNVGYLFLKDIYYDLKIHDICAQIAEKYKFEFDLNQILSMLLFSRIKQGLASRKRVTGIYDYCLQKHLNAMRGERLDSNRKN